MDVMDQLKTCRVDLTSMYHSRGSYNALGRERNTKTLVWIEISTCPLMQVNVKSSWSSKNYTFVGAVNF